MEIPEVLRGKTSIDVTTAGSLLGLGKNSSYAAAKRGDIPALRIGGRLIVPVAPLLKLLGITSGETTDAA